MGRVVECPWCRERNRVIDGERAVCVACRHRCDVPAVVCDCPLCRLLRRRSVYERIAGFLAGNKERR